MKDIKNKNDLQRSEQNSKRTDAQKMKLHNRQIHISQVREKKEKKVGERRKKIPGVRNINYAQ